MIPRVLRTLAAPFERPADLLFGAACVLAAAYVVSKVAQLALALWLGMLSAPAPRELAGPLAVFSQDLLAAGVAAAVLTGLAWLLRRLPGGRVLAPALVLPLLVLAVIHAVAQVVFYRLYQTPLTFRQLQLVGTLTDLRSAAAEATAWWVWLLLGGLAVASVVTLPLLAGRRERAVAWLGRGRRRQAAAVLAVALLAAWLVLPRGGCAGLADNGLVTLATSAARAARGAVAAGDLDLGPKPRFPRHPVTPAPEVEPTSSLIREDAYPRPRMNVVLFVMESTSWRLMNFGGDLDETMPALADLARRGVSFLDFYAITPVSMKSLVSITCSIHPYTKPVALTYVNPNIRCGDLAELLKEEGYRTALFHSGHFHYSDKDRFFRPRRYDVLRDADMLKARRRFPRNAWGADDRAMTEDALAWLKGVPAGEPFLLVLIPVTPHYPYQAIRGVKGPFPNKSIEGRYRNGLHFVDRQIRRLAEAVDRRGGRDDTLFVVLGDHGEAFEEHKGHTMHGSYVYEEAMRVPLVLSNPRLFTGARSHRIGNHVDLVPTIVEALGLPADERHEGVSLLQGYQPHLVHFYTEYAHHQLGLRDGRWKYIRDLDLDLDQLFDLSADPGETQNHAAAHPDLVAGYRASVERFVAFYQALIPHYETWWFPDHPCRDRNVCHLDELQPAFAHGAWKRNRSSRGGKLAVGGRRHARGLGVHAPSILRFNVHALGFTHLEGAVGHDDDIYAGQLAEEVSAQLFVDGELVFSSGKMKKGDAAREFRVSVEGARTVELYAHDMDGIGYRDMVDWVGVRLVR